MKPMKTMPAKNHTATSHQNVFGSSARLTKQPRVGVFPVHIEIPATIKKKESQQVIWLDDEFCNTIFHLGHRFSSQSC